MLVLVFVMSTFCLNFNVLLPVLAKHTLHAGPQTFGILSAVFGVGALIGALVSAHVSRATVGTTALGSGGFALSELLIAPLHSTLLIALLLFLGGICFTTWSSNSIVCPSTTRSVPIGPFGETFTRIHAIPTGGVPYLDYLAPGIMAQSAMFIAIFYGIVTIWERDAGVLAKLMATPTSRSALVVGKAFAASVRAIAQVVVVLVLSLILGVHLDWNAFHLLVALILVVLGVGFFTTLSISVAGLALKQERLMGIGQAITMPLFFGSNALYPVKLMPGWLQVVSHVNPLTYMVDGLRAMLIRTSGHVLLDLVVLVVWLVIGIGVAAGLLPRLVR